MSGWGLMWAVTTASAASPGHTGAHSAVADTDTDTDADTDADTDTDMSGGSGTVTCPDCQGVAGSVGEKGGNPCEQGCSTAHGPQSLLAVVGLVLLRRRR